MHLHVYGYFVNKGFVWYHSKIRFGKMHLSVPLDLVTDNLLQEIHLYFFSGVKLVFSLASIGALCLLNTLFFRCNYNLLVHVCSSSYFVPSFTDDLAHTLLLFISIFTQLDLNATFHTL